MIHPVLYRHMYRDGVEQFARFARNVWEISKEGKSQEELAAAGVQALADFVKEIGMPTTFSEMGITDKSVLKAEPDSCNLTAGCCRKFSRDEILEILEECW